VNQPTSSNGGALWTSLTVVVVSPRVQLMQELHCPRLGTGKCRTSLQSSTRLLNHSSSNTTSPSSFAFNLAWKATSIVISCPFCCPSIAPTTGPEFWRSVCRVMQSDIVRSTNGCSCTAGLVSEARAVERRGFGEASAMITVCGGYG
jgi:hypothetical protein